MGPATILGVAGIGLGAAAVLRQQREARAVASGHLSPLGPSGELLDGGLGSLHTAVAGWQPTRPTTAAGRALAATWAAPLTLLGVTAVGLGGQTPRFDQTHGCLVARGVAGPASAFLRGQGAAAATLGHVVVCRSERPSARLLEHEAVHVRQQERMGLLFALAYPLAQARWGYRSNPFEVAARRGAATSVTASSGPA